MHVIYRELHTDLPEDKVDFFLFENVRYTSVTDALVNHLIKSHTTEGNIFGKNEAIANCSAWVRYVKIPGDDNRTQELIRQET